MTEPDQPFTAPWQAKAFALVVALHERGHFTWPQWTEALAAEIAKDGARDYYEQWVAALEGLMG